MKAGDIVIVTDGSWSKHIVNGKLESTSSGAFLIQGQHWVVVETGCYFPLDFNGRQSMGRRNDTIICGPGNTDDIVFICSKYLMLADPPHVWKHGDVFKLGASPTGLQLCGGHTMMYLCPNCSEPRVIYLTNTTNVTCPVEEYLKYATFLFNIKDKL